MDKKPHKVEELKTTDAAKQSANAAIPLQHSASEFQPHYVNEATAGKIMEKLFRVHGNLLRQLAEYDRNG